MPRLPDTLLSTRTLSRITAIARALMRVPDYNQYLTHQSLHHPGAPLLTRAEFFAQRQSARFGHGSTHCC